MLRSIDSKVHLEVICVLSIKFDLRSLTQLKRQNKMNPQEMVLHLIMVTPDQFKTQEMCNEAVRIEPRSLAFVPDWLKTQEICNDAICNNSYALRFVPGHLRT